MKINSNIANFIGSVSIAAATALYPFSSSAELSVAEYRALLTEAKPIIIPPGTLPNTFTIYNGKAYLGKTEGGKTYSTDFYGKNLLDTIFEIGLCDGTSFDLITPMQGTSGGGIRAIRDLKSLSERVPFKYDNGSYNLTIKECVVYSPNSEKQKQALTKFKTTLCQGIKGIPDNACTHIDTDNSLSLYGGGIYNNDFYASGDKIIPVARNLNLVAEQTSSIDRLLRSLPSSDQVEVASKPTIKVTETPSSQPPAEEKRATIDEVVEEVPVAKGIPVEKPIQGEDLPPARYGMPSAQQDTGAAVIAAPEVKFERDKKASEEKAQQYPTSYPKASFEGYNSPILKMFEEMFQKKPK